MQPCLLLKITFKSIAMIFVGAVGAVHRGKLGGSVLTLTD